ncbi:MAG: ribulose-phosphate 3-epimerase, partial [Kineothrix sp.]|nr:ribulose-phosphate 3-epimerase [Kineothrix sp.]
GMIFDVHLMIERPERYIKEFAAIGADSITFHLEAVKEPGIVIDKIHGLGKKAGLSVKPATPISEIIPYADKLDMLLVMTVEPGFGGQEYIPESTERIREARRIFSERGLATDIQVDGGIRADNVHVVLEAGANVIVAGSAIFKGDIGENIKNMRKAFAAFEK